MNYGDLNEEKQARCDIFAEAYLSKCETSGHLGGTKADASRVADEEEEAASTEEAARRRGSSTAAKEAEAVCAS